MKIKIVLIFQFIVLFALQSFSCSGKDPDMAPTKKPITVIINEGDANFPVFKVSANINPSSIEWVFPEGVKIKDKRLVTYYFEQKGNYDVILNYSINGKAWSHTEKIEIKQNSFYFDKDEEIWWQDEFEDEKLDVSSWQYDIGSNKNNNIWGNNEWQDYTASPQNSFFRDGKLIIKAIKTGEGQKVADYTSARITTKGKKEINRGRVEVKAKLGGGVGLWPAIWLYQSSWNDKLYSELDIMEYVGVDKNIIYSAVHTNTTKAVPENRVGGNKTVLGVEDNYHIYGVNWTDGKVEFYIDNPATPHLIFTPNDINNSNDWPFNKKLYLILNIAVGGDWGGMKGVDDSIFPQEMEVEYVRVFQKKE